MLEIPGLEIRIIIISRQRKKKQTNKQKANKGADQTLAVAQLNRAFVLHAKNRFSQRETLIDHILFQIENVQLLSSCEICEDDALNVSRHRPIMTKLCIPNLDPEPQTVPHSININWKR